MLPMGLEEMLQRKRITGKDNSDWASKLRKVPSKCYSQSEVQHIDILAISESNFLLNVQCLNY